MCDCATGNGKPPLSRYYKPLRKKASNNMARNTPKCNPAKSRLCPGGQACVTWKKNCSVKKAPNPNRKTPNCNPAKTRLCGRSCVPFTKGCKGEEGYVKKATKKNPPVTPASTTEYYMPSADEVVNRKQYDLAMKAHNTLQKFLKDHPEETMTTNQRKKVADARRKIVLLTRASLKGGSGRAKPVWRRRDEEEAAEDIPFPPQAGSDDYVDGQTGVI
jgi:hypothetical protein